MRPVLSGVNWVCTNGKPSESGKKRLPSRLVRVFRPVVHRCAGFKGPRLQITSGCPIALKVGPTVGLFIGVLVEAALETHGGAFVGRAPPYPALDRSRQDLHGRTPDVVINRFGYQQLFFPCSNWFALAGFDWFRRRSANKSLRFPSSVNTASYCQFIRSCSNP
jgi:hypothetical protein